MKLIFVRHGQTDYNKQGILQGQEKDIPLNVHGIAQVEEAAQKVPSDVDLIVSSPLQRAMKTAEIINERLHKQIEFDDQIKEFKYGSLAGKTWPEIIAITGDDKAEEHDADVTFDYSPYGGESATDAKKRVSGWIEKMRQKYPDKKILVATHGGVIDTMHALFPQKESVSRDNAGINVFEF